VAAFLAMGVYALGAYLGWAGGGLGLLMVLLAPWSDPKMRLLMEAGVLLAAAAGVSVHLTLNRLEALQGLLGTLALNDPLTGLGNRRALELDYDRYRALAQREGNALWVSLWDLDGLKAVNDREGHAAGDRHLQAFARVLKEELREGDGVYRVGGDEFAALHLGLEGEALAERVRARFPAVSVGFAEARGSLEAALAEADAQMYRQKRLK
jgi:GGDEF domain-containing protein